MKSFIEIIKERINENDNREAFLFPDQKILDIIDQRLDTEHRGFTHGEMEVKYKAVAATLQEVAQPGDRVLILHIPGEEFIVSFVGCLYAGMIAVPIYPPNPARLDRTLPSFLAVIKDAAPSVILTNAMIKEMASNFLSDMDISDQVSILLTADIEEDRSEAYESYNASGDEIAMFQYTSGSTGRPSGVMLTYGNLADNLDSICAAHQYDSNVRIAAWLPPYHDMGLISCIITPLYAGGASFLMPPSDFLIDPNRWVQSMHWFKATATGAPNFGYEIMMKKFDPSSFQRLDLSSWRIAVNGAEPIKPSTLKRFVEMFEPYGFKASAFCPSYGMSEATNMVSGGIGVSIEPKFVQRAALEKNRKIIELAEETPEARPVLSCGKIAKGFDVRIVNPITLKECQQDYTGEIWLKSKSIGKGYWKDDKKTAATFNLTLEETNESGFLRTGDYGFIRDNQIYITGRLKDLIIVRGRNYHPEDIEQTVMKSHPNFAPGACAAFSTENEENERLIVVQEILQYDPSLSDEYFKDMFYKASATVSKKHGIQLSELIIIRRRSIHKTGSGKISRINNYHAWKHKTLKVIYNNKVSKLVPKDLPRTDTEQKLANIWKQLLNVDEIERSTDYMELGGDSIAVVELSAAIKEQFQFYATPDMIYKCSVLSALARAIDEKQVKLTTIDLDNEIHLSLSAKDIQQLSSPKTQNESILLTGATGFLGRYMLDCLLKEAYVKKVMVLVRDKDLGKARANLISKLEEQQLSLGGLDKVEFVYGDLSRPRLGMSRREFELIGANIDTIYHCGAEVDWVKPYTSIRAANVDGTRTIIELAATNTLKPLHYISTMWVLNPDGASKEEVIKGFSETHRAGWRGLENGYAQSKWVAENLIFKAADIGIPTTSHRMDFIVGSTHTGIIPNHDFLARLLQDSIINCTVSEENIYLDVVAVDYLAKAIIKLGGQYHEPGTVFHHRGMEQLSTGLMASNLKKKGYPIQRVPYIKWVETITRNKDSKSWPLKFFLEAFAMSPVITDSDYNNKKRSTYDRTIADLAKVNIDPKVDHPTVEALFDQMIMYFEKQGLI